MIIFHFARIHKGGGNGINKNFYESEMPEMSCCQRDWNGVKEGRVPVLNYDLDTIDGLAEASFYSILSTPSIVIEDEEEREVISWRGVVPTLQEVKQHLFRGIP